MDDALRRAADGFLEYLALEKGAGPNTLRAYRQDLAQALDFLRTLPAVTEPAALTTRHIRAFVVSLHEKDLAKSTIARRLAAVKSWCRWMRRRGLLTGSPAEALRGPRQDKPLPHFLSREDVEKLLRTPPENTPLGIRDRAILTTLYASGLRVSEVAGLNLEDLNLRNMSVRVRRAKGNRERVAVIGGRACSALLAWWDVRDVRGERGWQAVKPGRAVRGQVRVQDAVFINSRGSRLTSRSIGRLLEKYLAQAGLDPRVSPHSLRHSFATHLLDNGADIRSVQELLGHKSVGTTQIYTHVTTTKLHESYTKAFPRA